jgi:succinyldiaminopimelate transaminase
MTIRPPTATGYAPPPYPYDRLTTLSEVASRHSGGVIDLSIGTPCDPPPREVIEALAASRAERGYPPSVGTVRFRKAGAGWIGRRFGVEVDPRALAACVGTKEFVASVAWYLRLRAPERDTVLCPALAYPTYALGAELAGCRAVRIPEAAGGGLEFAAVSAEDASRAVVLWVNSPSNPSGSLTNLGAAAAWGRAAGVPVLSDECYAEFSWDTAPATILQHGPAGVLAVHSLSKRSNMAGLRAGFYAGDRDLVDYLSEVRKHAGLMVPGPVQAAAAVALDDDEHVDLQRTRYRRRLERLAVALRSLDLEVELPAGGFYLWVPVPAWADVVGSTRGMNGAWALTEILAERAGVLVSPGEFYGSDGGGHVRVALVQPDDRIELAIDRLRSADLLGVSARFGEAH